MGTCGVAVEPEIKNLYAFKENNTLENCTTLALSEGIKVAIRHPIAITKGITNCIIMGPKPKEFAAKCP